jgi:excisionase family DNA binding protein
VSERRVYSMVETAQILGLSRSATFRAAARGDIPVLRVGRRILVPAARLRALLGEEPEGEAVPEDAQGAAR